ncbi:MAG: DegT/DnrJ/EryC1/StrS family aminotransferase [Gallionellaceae bacterium]|nr:MAG: DegT/DnrJ/EryC1/StrS family aminotransferase [Gallionellaceae bacterium]
MNDIRLMKPYITFEEVESEFRGVFDSGIFTRGQHVEAFRRQIAEYTGAKHAFLMTSATTALWTSLKLLGVGAGDEVIVSDFSFPASANVVEDLGAIPVFADVDLDTFNMLPSELEKKITPRTKAVIFVDALGNPTGITEIKAICEKYHLPLIEDAACAIGSSENDRRCGSIADLTCFSFHPRKLLSTGEGGAITTSRDDWAEWLEVKLFHGAKGMKGMALDFVDYGYNFRLPELQAIMGRKQLAKIEDIVDERNRIRSAYIAQLEPLGFVPQQLGKNVRYNVQSLVFKVPEGCDRDGLILGLRKAGVESTIGTYALSSGTYYMGKYANPQKNAAKLAQTTITLPCFKEVDVDRVVSSIRDGLE